MPSKDIRKVTLRKTRSHENPSYLITDMDGMAELTVNTRRVVVNDTLDHAEAGWLAENWRTNEQDEDRNLTQYTLKIKGS